MVRTPTYASTSGRPRRSGPGRSVLVLTLALAGAGALHGQEVEIISGARRSAPDPTRPGIRVIAYVQPEADRSEHRVVHPLLPEEVRKVQEALASAGYDPGPLDGLFGPAVESALRAFQTDRTIEACGCVSYPTALALGLRAKVVQTVIGAPSDDPEAEVVMGNVGLPPPPPARTTTAPPETVVVHSVTNNWWGYSGFWAPFPSVAPSPPRLPGFPLGGPRTLGSRRPGGSR